MEKFISSELKKPANPVFSGGVENTNLNTNSIDSNQEYYMRKALEAVFRDRPGYFKAKK